MKRILALLVVAGVLAAMAAVAYADNTVTMGITGGSLSVSPDDVTLSTVVLDGTDKTSTSAYTSNAWTATDARGTGAGWNVTIQATDFSDGGDPAKTIDISNSDSEFKITIDDDNITVIAGNTKPSSSVTSLTAIPDTSALKIVSADTDTGMGSYNIPPAFEQEVPAETYVGTGTYTSTITVSSVTGP